MRLRQSMLSKRLEDLHETQRCNFVVAMPRQHQQLEATSARADGAPLDAELLTPCPQQCAAACAAPSCWVVEQLLLPAACQTCALEQGQARPHPAVFPSVPTCASKVKLLLKAKAIKEQHAYKLRSLS